MTINGVFFGSSKISGIKLFSICCICHRLLGVKSAAGARAGLSHGYCPRCTANILSRSAARRATNYN